VRSRISSTSVLIAALAVGAIVSSAQEPAPAAQGGSTYKVLTPDGVRTLASRRVNGQDMFALDDLATLFGLSVREDTLAGGLTVAARGQTIVLSRGQSLASVGGRLISLPAAPIPEGRTWLVPVEFVSRAVGPVTGNRIDLRKPSRLVIVGNLNVPRVSVRFDDEGAARARLTFDVDPATAYRVTRDGGRLVVGFDANAIDARLGTIQAGPLVAAIRTASEGASIVVDLGQAFGSYAAADVASGEGTSRFVLEVTGTAPPPAPGLPVPPAPPAPAPEPPPLIEANPAATLRAIVIDPGHGGGEDGARAADGTLEKDVTLAVARRLKSAIESRLGIRVILTRDGDQTVGLDERAARANNNKADLFISLHANASARAGTSGAEVFYLGLDEYGREAQEAARSDGVSLPVFGGGTREIELIPWELAQGRYIDLSAAFAGMVEHELRQRVPMSPRALERAPFRVLVGANMPAVLVEMGFLTNPDEARLLASDAFQGDVTQALFESIIRFRSYLRTTQAAPPAPEGRPEGTGPARHP
jgi:N-acetylmuramoyl-L-alanine amidase